jgi:putative Ca2+/H+ antiporter (TMEM165/GDT1 family)
MWKDFMLVFIPIFLAELGDKTQLTALSFATEFAKQGKSIWTVFLASSLALATSCFMAVLLAGFIARLTKGSPVVMDWIHRGAGVLFIVLGLLILFDKMGPKTN